MKKIFRHIKNYFRSLREANKYFSDTISYRAYSIRHMCRYHLYIIDKDYSLMDKFKFPASISELLETIKRCRVECETAYEMGVYDCREHYDSIRFYLRKLEFYAIRHRGLLLLVILGSREKSPSPLS